MASGNTHGGRGGGSLLGRISHVQGGLNIMHHVTSKTPVTQSQSPEGGPLGVRGGWCHFCTCDSLPPAHLTAVAPMIMASTQRLPLLPGTCQSFWRTAIREAHVVCVFC